MKFNKIHHIAIIASNYERSKEFYVNILGFEVIRESYREDKESYKLDLRISDSEIELFSFENPPNRVTGPEACGLRHIAFEINNIDEAVSYLNSNNIEVEPIRIDEFTGKRFTFFKDPDNLPIELYENKESTNEHILL